MTIVESHKEPESAPKTARSLLGQTFPPQVDLPPPTLRTAIKCSGLKTAAHELGVASQGHHLRGIRKKF